MISVIILTYNSAPSILRTLAPLKMIPGNIIVVDSFSQDNTVELCRAHGCQVVQRDFVNYADQRNWAIDSFGPSAPWQLHIDADEELDEQLIDAIRSLDLQSSQVDGYIFARRIVFMKKILRFGGIAKTWHMRLFRAHRGRVEDRLYDQHFMCHGSTQSLPGSMLDHQELSLSEWTSRHNRWSDLEVEYLSAENTHSGNVISGKILGNAIERKRLKKNYYYKLPYFFRSTLYFITRYIVLLGFLDGVEGLIYHVLQGFWFRFLIDAKLYERRPR